MIVKNVEEKDNKTTFQVEVDAESFDAAVQKAYQSNKGSISIPGFRKGKAPRSVIEGMYGKDVFYRDAMDELGPEALSYAITENKIKYVGAPSVTDMQFDDDQNLVYTFEVENYPVATLGEYKGIELEKPVAEVTEEQLNEQLENVKKRSARMVPAEREAQMGDTANIDFDGYLDGERFEGGKAEEYNLELGSNSFVPGFEEQIVGMKTGEEKDINITFPENYVEDLAGKDVVFKVKLNGLTMPEYPELDDEFAKDVSEFDTFEEYKNDLKSKMQESGQAQLDEKYRTDLMKIASDNMTVDIPEVMIQDKVDEIIRNYAANFGLRADQYPREKLAEMLGIDDETMKDTMVPAAEFQVRVDLMLEAVAEAENIEISEEDGNEYISKIAGEYGGSAEDLIGYFGKDFILNEYKKEKAADLIVEAAKDVKGKTISDYVSEEAEESEKEESKEAEDTKEE